MTSAPERRGRRRERIAGWLVAGIGFGLLALAVIALAAAAPGSGLPAAGSAAVAPAGSAAGAGSATATSAGVAPSTTGASGPGTPTAVRPALVVLNDTTTNGLARQTATRFRDAGWPVASIGNYAGSVPATCVYFDPLNPGAKAAAERLVRQFPALARTAPRFAELPSGPVVVVLAGDYTAG